MAGKIKRLLYTAITAFFAVGAVNCSDSLYFNPGNYDEPIVDLTRAGDDVTLSLGFSLSKDMSLNIVSLGEGIYDDLTDYGWIINADTREKVWTMSIEQSKHAGGAAKNKIAEEDIVLKKGSYIAFYKTDDSHSFEKWNDMPPDDAGRWGLSLYVKNNDDKRFISLFDEKNYKSRNLLAEIVHIRNSHFESSTFRLNKKTTIRIYAIGEGTRSEMYDFGWIEDTAGNILWKMDYKTTRYAGGAVKNRLAEDILVLPAGEYKIFYQTDDSHSFENWNANPPEDPTRYGLTLTVEDTGNPDTRQAGEKSEF